MKVRKKTSTWGVNTTIVIMLILYYFVCWPELTTDEVLANSIFLMIAGYDTTSSTLAWLLYELSRNADIQEKLLNDINSVMADYVSYILYFTLMK